MRTLVVGIPLPNLNFDNFTFLSAPSFIEYHRVIVDMAATARAVQEVVDGAAPHTTYGGQAIVNGAASAHAFPLAELLAMRHREAERLLANGGTIILIAHPETTVPNLLPAHPEEPGGGTWRSYAWIPEPEDFSYACDLLPGFGRSGAVLTDAEHPFAPYITELAPRIAYRAHINEDSNGFAEHGRAFARSSGGVAIAGEIAAAGGRLIILPALADPNKDRPQIAGAMVRCLERWDTGITTADTTTEVTS
jgi:hypothetical protein